MSDKDLTTFQGAGVTGHVSDTQVGALAAVAREGEEMKAAMALARTFPRDELEAHTNAMRSCSRPRFAEGAWYSYPRGGQTVKGPSVKLARELARTWGHISSGMRIVSTDTDEVHIRGWARDLQTGAYTELEDKFRKKIQRKRDGETVWVEPDERDLRELIFRRGAILERNCILKIVPPDLTDEAMMRAMDTMAKSARGELEEDRESTLRKLIEAFDGGPCYVSIEMLEDHLGHGLKDISGTELADLRAIYSSMKEGNTTRNDHFSVREVKHEDVGGMLPAEEKPSEATDAEKKADADLFAGEGEG